MIERLVNDGIAARKDMNGSTSVTRLDHSREVSVHDERERTDATRETEGEISRYSLNMLKDLSSGKFRWERVSMSDLLNSPRENL